MAGGRGERFWPYSRSDRPKQLLDLTGRGSMLSETCRRTCRLASPLDTYIATTEPLATQISGHIGEIPSANVILEPAGRNTAAALGLVALYLERRDPEGIMVALPADHHVVDEEGFASTLAEAVAIARRSDHIGTVGIPPTRPETGYGYIERDDRPLSGSSAYPVVRFTEKPDLEKAQEYLATGRFLWNSGMFIWRVSTFLRLVDSFLPELSASLRRIRGALGTQKAGAVIREEYQVLPSISVDYGIMEHAPSVFVIPARFGWDDVGSWGSLERVLAEDGAGNVISGSFVGLDSSGLVVKAESALVATVGISDLVIVESGGAILVCAKDRVQDVRQLVAELRQRKLDRYL
ncbi:MAG: mannose-1-phosphate guanylyltransferase [bacterium]|nr:mannose-1-phosphate guanylyltransferase [bacterium]